MSFVHYVIIYIIIIDRLELPAKKWLNSQKITKTQKHTHFNLKRYPENAKLHTKDRRICENQHILLQMSIYFNAVVHFHSDCDLFISKNCVIFSTNCVIFSTKCVIFSTNCVCFYQIPNSSKKRFTLYPHRNAKIHELTMKIMTMRAKNYTLDAKKHSLAFKKLHTVS